MSTKANPFSTPTDTNIQDPSTIYTNVAAVKPKLDQDELQNMVALRTASNYLAAAMIYLQDNFLLDRPLQKNDIKDRLLGHWGTCPGINLVYAHCYRLLQKHADLEMFTVVGPGHGAPAVLANLFLAGDLETHYPEYARDLKGLGNLLKGFSFPGGFPSHVNPELPGTIHEGGELGYSLAVSYGAIMNNPNLVVACIVGDGEAESGPIAAAWHSHKFVDPKVSGAVIPIVHANGYKISSETLFGTMSDENVVQLMHGYGYKVRFVYQMDEIDVDMADAMDWALAEIRAIQKAARNGSAMQRPRWPVIILRTPKGFSGIKELHGAHIEGSWRAHQVPAKDVKKDAEEFQKLEAWLRSYNCEQYFDRKTGAINPRVLKAVVGGERGLGQCPHTNPGFTPLDYPDMYAYEQKFEKRGTKMVPGTVPGGDYLGELWEKNKMRFKIFSPDELSSNKLDGILKKSHRGYQWGEKGYVGDGGVIEILSEHCCQGFMQGYLLTGRFAMFPSYEAFLGIVTTMMQQHAKFVKICGGVHFRKPVPSMNYVMSSTLWRQEHNGFSHQNPGFINSMLNIKSSLLRCYFPPDANCFTETMDHCMKSKNYINLVICSKLETPTWLNMQEAYEHCRAGASVWKWASTDDGLNPDVVLAACGNEVTNEILSAASLLAQHCPHLCVRVVNVTDLLILDTERGHPHGLSQEAFEGLFTKDKPVIFSFHGYPSVIKQLIFSRPNINRFHVLGYQEEGTTTTPAKMLVSNGVDRYNVCNLALKLASPLNERVGMDAAHLTAFFQEKLHSFEKYILKTGTDPEEFAKPDTKGLRL